jgi:hypothetical protein
MRLRLLFIAVWIAGIATAAQEPRWRVQFFHDVDREQLSINDIKFPSPKTGYAIGILSGKTKAKPMALVTRDGGANWTMSPLKEPGISLFFLNDGAGWMVTDRGLWFTTEGGRDWKKIYKNNKLERVYFLTPEHGWAIGAEKTVLETKDGGATWSKVAAAAKPETNPLTSAYHWINFNGQNGIIVGRSAPRRERDVPLWMETHPERDREWPSVAILLQTTDAGANWKVSAGSIFGKVTRIVSTPDGRSLALTEFENYFDWPSEILRKDNRAPNYKTTFREKNRLITDVIVLPDGTAYAAGLEPPGRIAHSPVPGRVKVLVSKDLEKWTEMPVDYRAVARAVSLAAAPDGQVWIATDTGMILHLE